MSAPSLLRLAPEYGCWPTWDDETGDNIDPADLSIPADLHARIVVWDGDFQATLDNACPPDSRFADAAAESAWRTEGEAILQALIDHLGPGRVRRGFLLSRQP